MGIFGILATFASGYLLDRIRKLHSHLRSWNGHPLQRSPRHPNQPHDNILGIRLSSNVSCGYRSRYSVSLSRALHNSSPSTKGSKCGWRNVPDIRWARQGNVPTHHSNDPDLRTDKDE